MTQQYYCSLWNLEVLIYCLFWDFSFYQVMPGLLLCFVLRYDNHLRTRRGSNSYLSYFQLALVGYFFGKFGTYKDHFLTLNLNIKLCYVMQKYFCFFKGLVLATIASEITKAAQPALLYLVPFTVLPLVTMAYFKVSNKYWVVSHGLLLY